MSQLASESPSPALRWYALSVRPQHERSVAGGLRAKGIPEFLPTHLSRRTWSDRVKYVDLPLFPGYVFCRLAPGGGAAAVRTPGVFSIVGFGGRPAPIEDAEVEDLARAVASGLELSPCPFLAKGQRVRIERGPLAGVEGTVMRLKDCWRVVLSVTLLQRSVAVEIARDMIAPIQNQRG